MQALPQGWPDDADVETAPELFLEFASSAWPPASDGVPAGTAELGAWSVGRSLTGSSLPGQVRGAAGFSIATGSATFAQPAGAPLTPWGRGNRRLGPGGNCTLYASHAGPNVNLGLALGRFVVAPISGANTRNIVALDLEENSIRLKRPLSIEWSYDAAADWFDAAWVVSEVARLNGYLSVPRLAATGMQLAASLCGWESAEVGTHTSSDATAWANAGGMIGLGPDAFLHYRGVGSGARTGMHFSCMVSGRGAMVNRGGITADVRPNATYFRMGSTHFATAPFPDDGATVRAVKISYERTGPQLVRIWTALPGGPLTYVGEFALPEDPGTWTKADPITVGTNASNGGGGTATRWIKGLQVHERQNFAFPAFTPTAHVEFTDSPLSGVFGVGGQSAWATIQDIASATMGAAWLSETGTLTYRNRDSLRGAGVYGETVEALDSIESLDWQVDPGDVADRVEMTYVPTTVTKSGTEAITLWEATDLIRVAAGATNVIMAEIEGTTDRLSGFLPIWNETVAVTSRSRWAASTIRGGGGDRPSNNALTVAAHLEAPGRVRITIRNNTTGTLWLVDGNGDPCLILRSSVHISPGEPELIAMGAGTTTAVNPLSVDTKAWVQDPEAAQRMLGWLSGQTDSAQATVQQVRVKPDLGRQLGDVIRLTDGHTGLLSKALVTGVHLSGDSGTYTQHLDLALLDLTFTDLDRWMQDRGITTFTQLDTFLQEQGITTFTALDEWGQDFGGTL